MSAFLVVDISVHDPEAYQAYAAAVPQFVAQHGGKYRVRGGNSEAIEGDWQPERVVVVEFPDAAAARAFVEDPDYQPVAAIRHAAATTRMVLVEGA